MKHADDGRPARRKREAFSRAVFLPSSAPYDGKTMNTDIYQDITIECRDCRQPFTWTAGQQAYFAARQLVQPRRCEQCRAWRRQQQAEAAGATGYAEQ